MDSVIDILNKWFIFTKYDREQHKFNLLSHEYDFHRACKHIEDILENYEPSGVLATMYAK